MSHSCTLCPLPDYDLCQWWTVRSCPCGIRIQNWCDRQALVNHLTSTGATREPWESSTEFPSSLASVNLALNLCTCRSTLRASSGGIRFSGLACIRLRRRCLALCSGAITIPERMASIWPILTQLQKFWLILFRIVIGLIVQQIRAYPIFLHKPH